MNKRLVLDMAPTERNGRNSEGSFLRAPNGDILFAYSHYNSSEFWDHDPCDIYMIRSSDEGESWSEPVCLAKARDFGVDNIMSVSGMTLSDGRLCFFFLVKDLRGGLHTTIGRVVSEDGFRFEPKTCACKFGRGYYVINNDRFIRLADGRIAAPAARHGESLLDQQDMNAEAVCLYSEDEGESFTIAASRVTLTESINQCCGMQEPGILELRSSVIWMWARTLLGRQYQCYSLDAMAHFTPPEPSVFTSPWSPMSVYYDREEGNMYAVYNPIPDYNGRDSKASRTPLVLRKSSDDGKNWGNLHVIEDDPNRGYCYTAMFKTRDNHLLCGYCRGHVVEDNDRLNRLGIMKIELPVE